MTKIKICGLTTQGALDASRGADFVGFVFYTASARYITPEAARALRAPEGAARVGLFVDPSDEDISATLCSIDMIQLHGAETPARAAEVRARFALPVVKAITVVDSADLTRALGYAGVVDWLLLDGSAGGQGRAFDWGLLEGFRPPVPWMLAGGLTPDNVRQAIALAHPDAVDVSSGVESARGFKDPALIRAFIEKVKIV